MVRYIQGYHTTLVRLVGSVLGNAGLARISSTASTEASLGRISYTARCWLYPHLLRVPTTRAAISPR